MFTQKFNPKSRSEIIHEYNHFLRRSKAELMVYIGSYACAHALPNIKEELTKRVTLQGCENVIYYKFLVMILELSIPSLCAPRYL